MFNEPGDVCVDDFETSRNQQFTPTSIGQRIHTNPHWSMSWCLVREGHCHNCSNTVFVLAAASSFGLASVRCCGSTTYHFYQRGALVDVWCNFAHCRNPWKFRHVGGIRPDLAFPLWTVACALEQKTHVHRLCFLSP